MLDFSILTAFTKAPWLVKGIISVLVTASLTSWALIFYHFFNLKKQKKQFLVVQRKIQGKDLQKYYLILKSRTNKLLGVDALIYAGFSEINRFEVPCHEVLENAEEKMQLVLVSEQNSLEEKLSWLATIGAVAPYIGLLGTVWGIMHAFRALGGLQQAAINLVAPGIAEALITTALGLLVAIPAVVAYNLLSEQVEKVIAVYQIYLKNLSLHFKREWLIYQLKQQKHEE